MGSFKVLGSRVPRTDAYDKVTGRALYTADLVLPGMIYGAFVRSPYAHARIKKIDVSEAMKVPGVVTIITQENLSRDYALVIEEEVHAAQQVRGLLAGEKVRYHGEKVALVGAETLEAAKEAAALVKVDYEPLPAVTDPREAVKEGAPLVWDDSQPVTAPDGSLLYNVVAEDHRSEGDVDQGFAESDLVYENEYYVHRVHQTYIEPQAAVAAVDERGRVTVWSSTQGHFVVRSNVARSLGIPLSRIRSIGMTVGGGFGAKFGGVVDLYAVLLALFTKRPAKIVYTREEDLLDARPAPGLYIRIKTGVKKDGTILARSAFALWNVGVGGGALWATGAFTRLYNIPHTKWDAYEIATNTPPMGAYRAPGYPQVLFAGETQLNQIAADLGMDPVELRRKNLKAEPGFFETLEKVVEKVGWFQREKGEWEGWGIALGHWRNASSPAGCIVSLDEDGTAKVYTGLMDLTGTETAVAEIVAETLQIPYEDVTIVRGDTDSAPFSPPSGGSTVTFSVGNAAWRAAQDLRQQMIQLAAGQLNALPDELVVADRKIAVKNDPERSLSFAEIAQTALRSPSGPLIGKGSFGGDPSDTNIFVQAVKVKVDPETGKTRLLRCVQALDVGRVINRTQCEGQAEGGALQSASWALMEEMQYDEQGRMINPNLADYRIPTAFDVPDMETILTEFPSRHGPYGAKGIGEPPITAALAAVASAIGDATGYWALEAPVTPERLALALATRQPVRAR
ncbi:MAG: xanthine dehydrogenase family protein molybdopterin-binding subunit [Armatimonadetes bacterium]|nr:xanthine dehydrogenase family protein molybdopterin-binding subunit [Armatimonadota bacterium]MDW8122992.1 xanthine dehydrogenase family protein molybdopterin-binding subunit [Armatimonadota bacterium]